MRFGVCTGFDHLPVLEQAGYDYIEPPLAATVAPERALEDVMPALRTRIAPTRLTPEAFNIFLPGDLAVVGEKIDRERQDRYLRAACARAGALGGRIIVFGSGRCRQIPDGFSPAEARRQVEDFLRRCGAAAARHHLTIAVESLNRDECNHITSVAEAVALAEAVAHPAVGVLSDLYHVTREGQSFAETRAAGAWLKHVHIAGAEGRRAPTAADIDFLAPFFAVLQDIGYPGRISVEAHWDDLPAQAAATRAALQRAWEIA